MAKKRGEDVVQNLLKELPTTEQNMDLAVDVMMTAIFAETRKLGRGFNEDEVRMCAEAFYRDAFPDGGEATDMSPPVGDIPSKYSDDESSNENAECQPVVANSNTKDSEGDVTFEHSIPLTTPVTEAVHNAKVTVLLSIEIKTSREKNLQ